MLYDRAETDAQMPRHLLLFGDGAWDNRMLVSDWKNCKPEDFLLCYLTLHRNHFNSVYGALADADTAVLYNGCDI